MKKLNLLLVALALVLLTGCKDSTDLADLSDVIDQTDTSEDLTESEIIEVLNSVVETITEGSINLDDPYEDYLLDSYTELSTSSDSFTITEGGVYVLSGTYTSTIIIDALDEDVNLVLDDATISVSSGPAILVLSADEVKISAVPGTENVVEDSANHPLDGEEDYGAAIYSFVDLEFNGTGLLTVNGNYNDAIYTKDDIKMQDITLNITSVDDGIVGRDYIALSNVNITTNTNGDSLKATNDESTEKGFIYIVSGTFNLNADADGIQAVNSILIYGGDFTINCGDDGIQSDVTILIGGGTFEINADADALNAVTQLLIYSGDFTITAGDDALHADETLQIEGGSIDILSSYEGIEAYEIIINGGTVNVVSTDDGINATTGGGQEHGPLYVSQGGTLTITGGIIQVNAASDGVDVNGSAVMSGGYLVVFGSTEDSQSSIDYDETFVITGGLLIALGSDGMLQTLSVTSSQPSLSFADSESYNEGTTITLTDASGNVLFELEAVKDFEAITFSSEDLVTGQSYTLEVDNDEYDFTISSIITNLGDGGQVNTDGGLPPRR